MIEVEAPDGINKGNSHTTPSTLAKTLKAWRSMKGNATQRLHFNDAMQTRAGISGKACA